MNDNGYRDRFTLITENIHIERLEHETQRLLALGVFVGIVFHIAVGTYFVFRTADVKIVKPPTIEFVVRQPRMTRPYELKKKRLKQRTITKRAMTRTATPSVDVRVKTMPEVLMGRISAFEVGTGINMDPGGYSFTFPTDISYDIKPLRRPDNLISMKEELITIDDLDTGRYKALVIQDPKDKRNIKGFVYIGALWGTYIEPPFKRSIIHLTDAINKYTMITAKVDDNLFLDSRDLMKTPFVYVTVDEKSELTEVEAKNFGAYLRRGGFAVFDNAQPAEDFSISESCLRWMLGQALGSDARFMPIPKDHPVYHCFFDFDEGPPLGGEFQGWDSRSKEMYKTTNNEVEYFLEGIWIKGRLVAIYSNKGYGIFWEDDQENESNEPRLKMGVNMVVFALIQEGGIAQRLMAQYTETQ